MGEPWARADTIGVWNSAGTQNLARADSVAMGGKRSVCSTGVHIAPTTARLNLFELMKDSVFRWWWRAFVHGGSCTPWDCQSRCCCTAIPHSQT